MNSLVTKESSPVHATRGFFSSILNPLEVRLPYESKLSPLKSNGVIKLLQLYQNSVSFLILFPKRLHRKVYFAKNNRVREQMVTEYDMSPAKLHRLLPSWL